MTRINVSFLTLSMTLLLFANSIEAAAYLKIPDIEGESTAQGYDDWIEVNALEWVRPCPAHLLVADPEAPILPDILIRKRLDKSSPQLMRLHGLYLGAEQGLNAYPPKFNLIYVLELPQGDGMSKPVVRWEVHDVSISGYTTGSGGGNTLPTEEMTLNFGSVRQTAYQYAPGGDLIDFESRGFVMRPGSTIPPPPDGGPGGSVIDSITIGEAAPTDAKTDAEVADVGEEALKTDL